MAATSPPGGSNNFLTRKLGPLPMWVWIAGAVAVAYWYKSRQSSSSSSSTTAQDAVTQALAAQGVSADQFGYSAADLGSMLQQLQSQVSMLGAGNSGTTGSGAASPGSTQTGAANQTAPAWVSSPSPVQQATAAKAGYNWVPNVPTLNALESAGVPVYYEVPENGGAQFIQWKPGAKVPAAFNGQPFYYTWNAPA